MSSISAGTTSGTALVNSGDTTGELVLKTNGSTVALTISTTQAIGVGTSPSYGTNGQVLTSAGSAAAPTWATVAAQSYPGAGIANSTGSAWTTSYTTSGTGTVVALATSPSLTTPVLGTPSSGTLSSCTVDGTNLVGFKSVPAVGTKTASYTLAVGDVGKYVQLGASGAIVIPDATFAEGNAITLFNNTASTSTITCSITTAYIAGTFTDKATMTLAAAGVATILFISGTTCVVAGNVT